MAGPNSSTQQTAPVTAGDIELAKLKVEQTKARWTGLSVIVPLLSAIVTVGVGVYTNYQTNKASFQLEVAKSIMQAPGPEEATNRAKFFAAIFPGRLPRISWRPMSMPRSWGSVTPKGTTRDIFSKL